MQYERVDRELNALGCTLNDGNLLEFDTGRDRFDVENSTSANADRETDLI
ncbi:MAG: hypothetical protein HC789_04715 [Microcoleus sp. CSU_2_2]|nr:hypothetical protein [Microcoleus sp. SU_5_3]NJS09727.1 hypothetical protein [Microcoleus sp. CSU_2_2]